MFLINSNVTRAKCHNNEGHDEGCGKNVSYLDRCVMGGGGGQKQDVRLMAVVGKGEDYSIYFSEKNHSLFDFSF